MADRLARDSAAAAVNLHRLGARIALPSVAQGLAEMTAFQLLLANPVTVRNIIFTGLTGLLHEFLERCLATRAMGDNVRRERAMSRDLFLRVTRNLATMYPTIEGSSASTLAAKGALKPRIVGEIERIA